MVLENFLVDADILWDRAGKELYEKPEARAGRKMRVRVTNRGVIEDLTGFTLNLGWTSTKDETKFGLDAFDVVDATKGLYELDYTSGMLTNIGNLKAVLQLVPLVGEPTESNNFMITVKKSALDPGAVQSETSFTALAIALVQVNGWNATIGGKVVDWEADMAATKQLYIDNMEEVESTYPQELVSLGQQLEQKADKAEVANGLTAKGSILYASLPTTDNGVGDYYFCSDGDDTNPAGNYVWNGTAWYFGGTGDNGYNQLKDVIESSYVFQSDGSDFEKQSDIAFPYIDQRIQTGGTLIGEAGVSVSDFIDIKTYPLAYRYGSTNDAYPLYAYAEYDSEKHLVAYHPSATPLLEEINGEQASRYLISSIDTKYVRISRKDSWTLFSYKIVPDKVHIEFQQNISAPNFNYPKLQGKRILTLGDSITFGEGASDRLITSYPAKIAEKSGAVVTNSAVSGSSLTYRGATIDNQYNSVYTLSQTTDFTQYDVVTIFIGTNDWGYPIEVSDLSNDYKSQTQMCVVEALNKTIQNILTSNPKIRIHVFTPMYRDRQLAGDGLNSDDNAINPKSWYDSSSTAVPKYYLYNLSDRIEEICRQNHVPCKNMYRTFMVNKYNAGTYLSDGLHGNDLLYDSIADVVCTELSNNCGI